MHLYHLFALPGLVTALLLAGCEPQQTGPATPEKPPPSNTAAGTTSKPDETGRADHGLPPTPIDLSIDQAMFDALDISQAGQPTDTAQAVSALQSTAKADKLNLSGKLILDEEIPGYVESVEGAEVNVEIKFR